MKLNRRGLVHTPKAAKKSSSLVGGGGGDSLGLLVTPGRAGEPRPACPDPGREPPPVTGAADKQRKWHHH